MNKSGVWKSLELKADETKEAKKNDSRTSTKDSSPDTGIVIKVLVSCTLLDSVKIVKLQVQVQVRFRSRSGSGPGHALVKVHVKVHVKVQVNNKLKIEVSES